MQQHHKTLLSLPQLPLLNVVQSLNKDDKRSLVASCRSLAMLVSQASANCRVTVTSNTGWEGLCKVLTTETVSCKEMVLKGALNTKPCPDTGNALDMLLTHGATCEIAFHDVRRLVIEVKLDVEIQLLVCTPVNGTSASTTETTYTRQARPLPCLLPASVASKLPNLEELCVQCAPVQFAGSQPVAYCSSLRKVKYTAPSASLQLPSQYHTPEDLRRQLPNVTALCISYCNDDSAGVSTSGTCTATMLQAWGNQLTDRKFLAKDMPVSLQHCTQLRSLSWHAYLYTPSLLPVMPQGLSKLQLTLTLHESDLATILQLSSVTNFQICKFSSSLQQDWSKHLCSWKQLTIGQLHVVDLSRLPLHSLKGHGCLTIRQLQLPNPSLPNSLEDVTYAAQCVRDAGITIEGLGFWQRFDNLRGQPMDPSIPAPCKLLRAAGQVVRPYNRHNVFSNSALDIPFTTAILAWASHSLLRVYCHCHISTVYDTWFWLALRQCCKLEELGFDSMRYDSANALENTIRDTALWASEHVAKVTRKPLKLYFIGPTNMSQKLLEAAERTRHLLQEQPPGSVCPLECCWVQGTLCLAVYAAPCN